MTSAVLEDTQRAGDYKESNQSGQTVTVKFSSVVTRTFSGTAVKSFQADASKSESLSRVSTRRFTGSHVVEIGDLQSANLTGMDSSAVISAWGLSSPRVDFFASNTDIHREFNADLLNLIPTDRSFAKRVGDRDAFIKDGHLGADKAEMKEIADQQRPTQGRNETITSFYKKTLCRETSAKKITETSEEVTTSCAVDLRISHVNSLSRKVVR